jgi:hypothetical protein
MPQIYGTIQFLNKKRIDIPMLAVFNNTLSRF